jgi:hypothetical protein
MAERTQLVGQMTRLKNRIQSILHANLIPKETGHIFSKRGRGRLAALPLPADQTRMALRHHDELARLIGFFEPILPTSESAGIQADAQECLVRGARPGNFGGTPAH